MKILKPSIKVWPITNNRVKKDFDYLRKSTLLDIENLSSTYYLLLNLLPALASVAAADKKAASKFYGQHFH